MSSAFCSGWWDHGHLQKGETNIMSGMSAFTVFHVLLSLVGIAAGFVVIFGLLLVKRLPGWTATFLATTVLTSVTGFLFPVHHFMPSHGFGIVSIIALALAIYALYLRRLAGGAATRRGNQSAGLERRSSLGALVFELPGRTKKWWLAQGDQRESERF